MEMVRIAVEGLGPGHKKGKHEMQNCRKEEGRKKGTNLSANLNLLMRSRAPAYPSAGESTHSISNWDFHCSSAEGAETQPDMDTCTESFFCC
jgi:hypothetical protein